MNYQDKTTPSSAQAASASTQPNQISPERMRRALIIGGIVVAVFVGLLVGYRVFTNQMMKSFFASNTPPPVSVNFETVQSGDVARSLTTIGSVAAIHQVTISPEISGQVRRIAFIPGSPVKKGDVIVEMNDATEQADLANARAQQKLTGLTLARFKDLAARGAASQAQLDQAQSQYDAATAQIARTEAVIAKKLIRAPFNGTLGVRQTEVGHYLEAGRAIVVITDMEKLFVEFGLPEQVRPKLSLGQAVNLTVDAYPGKTFTAIIAVIDPQVNTATRTIRLQAVADNSEGLMMPGMFANIAVQLPSDTGRLTIPETALDYSLYGNSVYVIQDGGKDAKGQPVLTAKRTTVQTGTTNNGRIVVESGLNPGERIVTTGLGKLFDGAHLALNATPTLVKPNTMPVP
jgi:membrane fusion protein, multidrug efflux system